MVSDLQVPCHQQNCLRVLRAPLNINRITEQSKPCFQIGISEKKKKQSKQTIQICERLTCKKVSFRFD